MMGVMAETLVPGAAVEVCVGDFGVWMQSEQKRVFLLCRRLLQDSDEADMATQDAFLKAYKAFEAGAGLIEEPSKWLTRIAVNTCLDRVRSRAWKIWRRRPKPADEETILAMERTREPSPEDRTFARQVAERIGRSLERLSPRQRAVFTLKHYEDLSLEEIAGILGLDIGTVKAHMARALRKLRIELRDLYAPAASGAAV